VPGQHRAGEIVEAGRTCLAPISLPSRLGIVAPVPDHRRAVAPGAMHALWPAMLAHEGEALGVVNQAGEGPSRDLGDHDDRDRTSRVCCRLGFTNGMDAAFGWNGA